jgi:hypothetical protein
MQSFLSGYANAWSRRHRFSGHVFQGRYRTELVEDENDLGTVTRDVHLNPVRAGTVEHPAASTWSSDPGYAHRRRRLDWVAYDELLASWGGAFGGSDPVLLGLSRLESVPNLTRCFGDWLAADARLRKKLRILEEELDRSDHPKLLFTRSTRPYDGLTPLTDTEMNPARIAVGKKSKGIACSRRDARRRTPSGYGTGPPAYLAEVCRRRITS